MFHDSNQTRRLTKWYALGVLLVTSFGVTEAFAQAVPKREGAPRPVVLSQGSIGVVSAMKFSPDSRFLYVVGLDKTVHMWSLLEPRPNDVRPTYLKSMRWEVSRGYQGNLNTVAISPDGQLLAAAGTSARNNGDIGAWDTGTGRMAVVPVFPRQRAANADGHAATVTEIDFSPDGQKLISIDKAGAVWLWDRATGTGIQIQPPSQKLLDYRQPIVFVDNEHVASSAFNGQTQLVLFDVTGKAPARPLANEGESPVVAMARQPAGKIWATASESGVIRIWDSLGQPVQELRVRQLAAAMSLSFLGADGLIAARERTRNEPAKVEVWNWRSGQLLDTISVGRFDECRAVAASPDGRWLAYSYPDTDEVRLIPVSAQRQGQLPPVDTHLRLAGRGQPIWESQFAGPGLKFRFSDRRKEGVGPGNLDSFRGFDLNELRLLDEEELKGVSRPGMIRDSESDRGDWTLQLINMRRNAQGVDVPEESGFPRRIHLYQNQILRGTINLDVDFQGPVRSHCWIARPGDNRPFAIAFGTEDQNGIYIYSLPSANESPRLLRYFRDHVGAITSLSVSADRRILMSSSLDQTVKFWSLEELSPPPGGFVNRSAWGADFVLEQNGLIARNVLPNGIAARRGIRNGDKIDSLTETDYDGLRKSDSPEQILRVLTTRDIYKQILLLWTNGPPAGRLIVPAWEPLATFFVDRHDEWILFTPEGIFHASAAEGPVLLGWQYNRGRGFDPELIEAGELIKELQKPDVLKQLFVNPNPPPAALHVDIASAGRPEIKIVTPRLTDPPAKLDEPVQLVAHVEYPPNAEPAKIQNLVYVNSQQVPETTGKIEPYPGRPEWFQQTVTAQIRPREDLNSVRINSTTLADSEKLYRTAASYSQTQIPPNITNTFRLHLISISCQDYSKDGVFPPLTQAKADGDIVRDELIKHAGAHFTIGHILRLDDTTTKINRSVIRNEVSRFSEKIGGVSPNDLVIVFLSGHGHVVQESYRYVPSSPVFRNDQQLMEHGVCISDFEPLFNVDCRRIFLVDTCRAGDISDSVKRLFDEARTKSMLMFSATSQGQKAEESRDGKLSVFTSYLVDGLNGAADGFGEHHKVSNTFSTSRSGEAGTKDRVIEFAELTKFIETKVPLYTGRRQKPCFFNRQQENLLRIKVCNVR